MEKLKMQSPNLVDANIDKIAGLFPNCITEDRDENGIVRRAVDFDLLRQELSASLVEGPRERYTLNWPGKNEAILTANAPIAKTLRPCREESVDFENTRNIYIEGDNLDALKLLQEIYLNKVKLIYIDPPYNTGNDFIYEDDFAEDTNNFFQRSNQKDEMGNRLVANTETNGRFHSDWMSMIYSRLKIAKNLLREDGVIIISIDDNELANLRLICGEIFGNDNFLVNAVWKKKYTGGKHSSGYVDLHEYVIVYCKNKAALSALGIARPEDEKDKFVEEDEFIEERGKFYVRPLKSNLELRQTLIYKIVAPDGSILETQWLVAKDTFEKLMKQKRVEFRQKRDGSYQIYRKYYEKDGEGIIKPPSIIDKFPNTEGKVELKKLFCISEGRDNVFYTVKPLNLIKHLIEPHDESDAIILDFFSGSGTTGHAVMSMNATDGGNRRYILVQLTEQLDLQNKDQKNAAEFCLKLGKPASIAELAKERIRRAGKIIKEESPLTTQNLDTGFRVFKVDTSNMKDVYYAPDQLKQDNLELFKDHIKPDRSAEDLLFQVFIDWGLDLTLPIAKETIDGKTVFFVDGNSLVACFDSGITEELVKKLAAHKPLRVVFRDDAFGSDSVKINVEQIFKLLSPATEVKSI